MVSTAVDMVTGCGLVPINAVSTDAATPGQRMPAGGDQANIADSKHDITQSGEPHFYSRMCVLI
jgi:hypothetical protein